MCGLFADNYVKDSDALFHFFRERSMNAKYYSHKNVFQYINIRYISPHLYDCLI